MSTAIALDQFTYYVQVKMPFHASYKRCHSFGDKYLLKYIVFVREYLCLTRLEEGLKSLLLFVILAFFVFLNHCKFTVDCNFSFLAFLFRF